MDKTGAPSLPGDLFVIVNPAGQFFGPNGAKYATTKLHWGPSAKMYNSVGGARQTIELHARLYEDELSWYYKRSPEHRWPIRKPNMTNARICRVTNFQYQELEEVAENDPDDDNDDAAADAR